MYCGCWTVLSKKVAIGHLITECREWIDHPCKDEASDVLFAAGRLIGACMGKEYVHVPGDGMHIAKINARFKEYGCIRSKNHKCGE